MEIRTNEWQETYMAVLTTYLLKLLENADTVPQYLKETLPTMYKPENLLSQVVDEELDAKVEEPFNLEQTKEIPKAEKDDSDSFEILSKEEPDETELPVSVSI